MATYNVVHRPHALASALYHANHWDSYQAKRNSAIVPHLTNMRGCCKHAFAMKGLGWKAVVCFQKLSSDAFLFSFANHCNGNLANCWHAASLAYVLELHPARFGDRTRLGGLLLLLKWWYIYIYIFIYIISNLSLWNLDFCWFHMSRERTMERTM